MTSTLLKSTCKRTMFLMSFFLAVHGTSYGQGALDILDRASRSASQSYGSTLNNTQRRMEMNQAQTEQSIYNRCLYQTGGDVMRCSGYRQTETSQISPMNEPEGTTARLVIAQEQVRTVSGGWATKCVYEVYGQQFVKLFDSCPNTIRVR